MLRPWKHLARFLAMACIVGWLAYPGYYAYPGWWHDWYFNWPGNYAYPASMSTERDPHWGHWWW
jgi:hypothetical protein